jgi:hypothetical protein
MEASRPEFDWDLANVRHIARHDVTPGEAEEALENDPVDPGYDVVTAREARRNVREGYFRVKRIL